MQVEAALFPSAQIFKQHQLILSLTGHPGFISSALDNWNTHYSGVSRRNIQISVFSTFSQHITLICAAFTGYWIDSCSIPDFSTGFGSFSWLSMICWTPDGILRTSARPLWSSHFHFAVGKQSPYWLPPNWIFFQSNFKDLILFYLSHFGF